MALRCLDERGSSEFGFIDWSGARENLSVYASDATVRIPTVAIVGHKNSGKTTLVVRLVEYFTRAGMRVAAIKHTSDEVGFDKPDRDSDRIRRAGSVVVGMVARDEIGLYTSHTPELSETWLEATFAKLPDPPQMIIYEGYRGGPHPKIECILKPEVRRPSFSVQEGLIAVVSDHAIAANVPVLAPDSLDALAEVIRKITHR